MGDLSQNFDEKDFACQCSDSECKGKNVHAFKPLERLVAALEALIVKAGGKKITISSGIRCAEHNKAVGGESKSLHVAGKAADIMIEGLTPGQMYALANDVPAFRNGGIGVYPDNGFIHVDVRGYRARWAHRNGKFVPLVEIGKVKSAAGTIKFSDSEQA